MLKRLELIGFKSFADRTVFDFAPGITAVVGPNGSGKSNVVDAVRWILGEQSAKSLRGSEMTDVIFNGSASRKSLGMAEVTLVFDNIKRQLDIDTDDVQITRRVYRDGQGEYLLNGREARLREIKELFLGSGAGHGAYSVIEQGRVDALLTVNNKDRRAIFEEAAGISRFKVKKAETLKKLEHVDTDLIRVHDVLSELEKQLRTLRSSAAKATKYQEYLAELKHLRVSSSAWNYTDLSVKLEALQAELSEVRAGLSEDETEQLEVEQHLATLVKEQARTDETAKNFERRRAELREQIAGLESITKSEAKAIMDVAQDRLSLSKRRYELEVLCRTLQSEAEKLASEVAFSEQRWHAESERVQAALRLSTAAADESDKLSVALEATRAQLFHEVSDEAKKVAALQNAIEQRERLRKAHERKEREHATLLSRADALSRWLSELDQSDEQLKQKLEALQHRWSQQKTEQTEYASRAQDLQPELQACQARIAHLTGRAEILEDLERNLDGLNSGIQHLLQRRAAGDELIVNNLHGMVADLLQVPREVAALVDLVLAERALYWVARGPAELEQVLTALGDVPGRVGFIMLSDAGAEVLIMHDGTTPPPLPLSHFVQSDIRGLVEQLFNAVFIVPDQASARYYAKLHPKQTFVTAHGACYSADGTVTIGPIATDAGFISRKSEQRELRAEQQKLEQQLQSLQKKQQVWKERAVALHDPIRETEAALAGLNTQAGDLRQQILQQRQTLKQDADYAELLQQELDMSSKEINLAEQAVQAATQAHAHAADSARTREADVHALTFALQEAEIQRRNRATEESHAREQLGRVHEQYEALKQRAAEQKRIVQSRISERHNVQKQELTLATKQQSVTLAALNMSAQARLLYAELVVVEDSLRLVYDRRSIIQTQQQQYSQQRDTQRQQSAEQRQTFHTLELQANETQSKRQALVQRIRDDYNLDLTTTSADVSNVDNAETRIEELRGKIAKLGAVNLESLEELRIVEAREQELRSQFDDLNEGRRGLMKIIDQINGDSKRLFTETLGKIRIQFQELFRKLFGGGHAEILLDTPDDPLESGIDITAHPPGKQPQRISLLSGGERALTAVALLLAIFRTRPSPFCLLDEIDAAMDEANTQRLAELLGEFSDRSQFIVITHKKRTMAKADVLHGVTMQESGISRLYAVRFEDWPEDERQAA